MVWGAGLGSHNLFPLRKSTSASLGRSGRGRRLLPCITRRNCGNRLGTWNIRGINGIAKREEVVDVFREKKFVMLALTKTELKGKREVSWCGVNAIIAGAQEMERDREAMATMCGTVQ